MFLLLKEQGFDDYFALIKGWLERIYSTMSTKQIMCF
jgi:hypothetical protein